VSHCILTILQKNFNADASGRHPKQIIDHQPADDLESLFYVLVWICVLYDGPNNSPRTDISFEFMPLYKWAEQDFARGDFAMCSLSKFELMTSPDTSALTEHITPYFKCLEPFLLEWRTKIGKTLHNSNGAKPVQHEDVLEVLTKALTHIRTNPSSTSVSPSDVDPSHPPHCPPQAPQKRAKHPIPPSNRQLRPRNTGVSLGETLVKRVPRRKRGESLMQKAG
jgi:hypothetical protein